MLDRLSLTMARLYGHDLGKCTPDLPLSTIPKGPLRDSEETRQSVFVAMLRKVSEVISAKEICAHGR